MPTVKRRKLSPAPQPTASNEEPEVPRVSNPPSPVPSVDPVKPTADSPPEDPASARLARFTVLKSRAASAQKSNLAATRHEASRLSTSAADLPAIQRRHALASHNLLKASTDDFERKRAWDWTIEESERWDERVREKGENREQVAFQDYGKEAAKVYERQVKGMKVDLEGYQRDKIRRIEAAAASGVLEIVETEDGELVAVDKDGEFLSTNSIGEEMGYGVKGHKRPEKEAIDRLVRDLRKAEEVARAKRRARGQEREDGDVTYINEKNKQFNMKLARFFNKYTSEIRESFERGTMI